MSLEYLKLPDYIVEIHKTFQDALNNLTTK